MATQDAEHKKTRDRILAAAAEVFAGHGFHSATIRDICGKASVNIAAIHYHFGSKEKLYEEACRHALKPSGSLPIRLCGAGDDFGPAEKLRGFIQSFLTSLLDPQRPRLDEKIMFWEMSAPTGALDMIISDLIKPHHEQLCRVVAALLGPAADDDLIKKCAFSIVGQCMHYRHGREVISRLHPAQRFDVPGIANIADHITRFSLAAIRQIAGEQKEKK